ncbi:MAG: hypothetical protein ACSHXY_08355 [Alphaproteobacteria bacterium]
MRKFLSILIGVTALIFAAQSSTADTGGLCRALERPNIDCSCVTDRMNMFQAAAPTELMKALFKEQYALSIGADNNFEPVLEEFNRDPMTALTQSAAMDRVGGMPSNIGDFEAGCVIPGAQNHVFPSPSANSQAALFVEAGVKSAGENSRNSLVCHANRLDSYLSRQEFEAYQLSYSYYGRNQTDDDDALRARKMGVSRAQYKRLAASGRQKYDETYDKDSSYCSAMTYAARITPEQNQAALDRQAAQAADAQNQPVSGSFLNGDDETKARKIMQSECSSNGGSSSFCGCVMADFEKKVVQKSPRPGVTLAWALMRAGSSLPSDDLIQLTMASNRNDQKAAGQMFMSTMDVGDSCTEAKVTPKAMKGDPRERMIEICTAENENKTMCICTTDKMRSKLSSDDFELIVDIREADFRGADDPLAEVAADRGLTAKEAEQAMMTNQSLMGGIMAMDMMSCMGGMPGMPDMSQIPGMPKLPGQ